MGTELYGPLGTGEAAESGGALGGGATVDVEALGVTGTEVPGATSGPAEHAVREAITSNDAVAVREKESMTHLRW